MTDGYVLRSDGKGWDEGPFFDTPEEAALEGWRGTPSANARVVEVRPTDDFDGVYVIVETDANSGLNREAVSVGRAESGKWTQGASTGI